MRKRFKGRIGQTKQKAFPALNPRHRDLQGNNPKEKIQMISIS